MSSRTTSGRNVRAASRADGPSWTDLDLVARAASGARRGSGPASTLSSTTRMRERCRGRARAAAAGRLGTRRGPLGAPGSRTVKSLPLPGPSLAAVTLPPCSSTSARTRVSPIPRPALRAGQRPVPLGEELEDVGEHLGRDARSRCRGPGSTISSPSRVGAEPIRPAGLGVLGGVAQQVRQTCSSRVGSASSQSGPGATDDRQLVACARR